MSQPWRTVAKKDRARDDIFYLFHFDVQRQIISKILLHTKITISLQKIPKMIEKCFIFQMKLCFFRIIPFYVRDLDLLGEQKIMGPGRGRGGLRTLNLINLLFPYLMELGAESPRISL